MDVSTLRAAMAPTSLDDATLTEYLPHFVAAMEAAEITTVNRAAAWCSQIGHESGGLKYMAEIATDGPGWTDDRRIYRGRGPIQLTWQGNYRKFGNWCAEQGFVTNPELFMQQPELVEEPKWGFLAASWYWLNGGPREGQINGFADARDILAVSRCVNGWPKGPNPPLPNGYADRCARWNRCLALGDQLLTGGSVAAVTNIGDPVWLEDVLRPALGDRLKTLPGWQESGHGDYKDIRGVMVHHTGNSRETAQSIRNGRPDLEGPLSNLHIDPKGIVTIVAVGVCWHAGAGAYPWLPTDMANWHMIGIECAWPDVRAGGQYNASQKWPDAQIISMRDTCAALIGKLGHKANRVIGHKEWAGASQGKWDPGNLDMPWFRGEVAKDLAGFVFPGEAGTTAPQPGPILPPADYGKEVYDQLRIEWKQLGGQTLVNAVAEIRDKVCGVTDYADWKAGK